MDTPATPVILSLGGLTLPKEKDYFVVVLVFSIFVWLGLALTIFGLFYAALFAFFAWLGNGLLAAMAIPAFAKVRQQSMVKICVNNERMIAAAYEQCEMAQGKSPADLGQLVGPGKPLPEMPRCPAGGHYTIRVKNGGGCTVKCSVHPLTPYSSP